MKLISAAVAFGVLAAVAAPMSAQQSPQPKDSSKSIPAAARPPKGMCRVWIDGVPAAQQPGPTDCRTALKNRPPNSRVIFGDDYKDSSKTAPPTTKLPAGAKGFQNVKPPVVILPTRPPTTPGG